jgi:glycosyltransferase involved in cell wall biosynthesis
MKIGLYGGMANNMYVFAKAMAKHGADVCFIRDRSDRYPFSQPVWQDLPFRMDYQEIPRANDWPWTRWQALEDELGWKAPAWLYDPLTDCRKGGALRASRLGYSPDGAFLKWYLGKGCRAAVLHKMKGCDALLVCGVEGSLLANASGKPFIILPHGGDLMIAAGVLPAPPGSPLRVRLARAMERRQLVMAYRNALCVGVHEPSAFSADFYGAEDFFRRQRIYFLAVPVTRQERLPAAARREALNGLLARMKTGPLAEKYVGLVPSRVDFEWKGQDRLLQALAALEQRRPDAGVHLIFSGWGKDLQPARDFVRAKRQGGHVTFLDAGLSKPVLSQFYCAVDFVVDQFIVGMTGTSALEAMACAAPVMMWVNDAVERYWGQPPVIQARSALDIERALGDICDGHIDLDHIGRRQQEWVLRQHDPAKVVRGLEEQFAQALAA